MGRSNSRLDGLPTLDETPVVRTEQRLRSIRFNGDSFSVTLNKNWAGDLGIDQPQTAVDERCIAIPDHPVVIDQPAFIILPTGGDPR